MILGQWHIHMHSSRTKVDEEQSYSSSQSIERKTEACRISDLSLLPPNILARHQRSTYLNSFGSLTSGVGESVSIGENRWFGSSCH